MTYITSADLETRVGPHAFVQLADDNGDGQADTGVIDDVISAAEGEVNSYLAGRYALPVDTDASPQVARLIQAVTLDIAELRLRARRPPVSEDVLRRGAQTQLWLGRLAERLVDLPATTPLAPGDAHGPAASTSGRPRSLNLDEFANW